MKNLSNNSNKKNKVTGYFTCVALVFMLIISSALLAQAQIAPPTRAQLEQRQREREKQIRLDIIFSANAWQASIDRAKRQRESRFKEVETPKPVLRFALQPPPVFQTNDVFTRKPAVVLTSTLPARIPALNLSSTNSNLQTVPSLNMVSDLGNGVIIVKDAAGNLYSLRVTNAVNIRRGAPARKQQRKRRAHSRN